MPRPGRPSLFCPERTAAICAIIMKEGISDSAAGALAGVTASTLSRWKLEHEEFALELEVARALFEIDQVRAIRNARKRDGSVDWRAVAWLLKHSSPEGFGPLSRRRPVKRAEAGQNEREPVRGNEKCAFVPETRAASDGQAGEDGRSDRANDAATCAENRVILPETPGGAHSAPGGLKLSRRERRAEERRQVKAMRTARREAA
ncbi:MAG TPA: hypothetical protein VGO11_16640 [Chthoniobacteraceae bacterium]|nr:hypothetical protein [Chthoniobacteraceae bacterium]